MRTLSVALSILAAIVALPVARRSAPTDVSFPDGYRHWTHVRSAVIGPNNPAFTRFGGIHHIYANDAAMRGYAAGHFPNGAVLVFDRFDAIASADDAITQGPRRVIDVMRKDSSAFGATGGWGFEEFAGDSHDRADGSRASCAECHATQRAHDYVFSVYKE